MMWHPLLAAIVLLTLASAFFSCSEVAFFSLPASRVRSFRFHQDERKRQVARILSRSKSLLVTIFMYNTIVNVLLQNASSDLFAESSYGWTFKVGLPLVLVLFVGELAPKYFGLVHNERLALRFAPTIEWLEWLITPLRKIITKIASILSRLFFFFLKAEPELSKEELAHILQSSEGKGLLHRDEAELIYGVLDLEEKKINEIMLKRYEMPLYDIDEPITKLIHIFSEQKVSEVALFEMPQEKMLGVVRARDFFLKRSAIAEGRDLLKILRKPFYVPETTSAKAFLEQLQAKNITCAWVVDEYGASVGFVTEQDLLAEVVGQSKGAPTENAEFERVSKDAIVASGTLALDDVRELFDVKLQSEHDMVTIGGFISEKLGFIPQAGTTLEEETLFMRVLSSDQTRIRKVYIQRRK